MRWLVLAAFVALAGCSSDEPAVFDFHVDAAWSSAEHPEITSVTIDGDPVFDGKTWMWDDESRSYVDATEFFVRGATVTTAAGHQTSLVVLSSCNRLDQVSLKRLGHLFAENDVYAIDAAGALSWTSGTCFGVDGTSDVYSARTNEVTFQSSPRGSTTTW